MCTLAWTDVLVDLFETRVLPNSWFLLGLWTVARTKVFWVFVQNIWVGRIVIVGSFLHFFSSLQRETSRQTVRGEEREEIEQYFPFKQKLYTSCGFSLGTLYLCVYVFNLCAACGFPIEYLRDILSEWTLYNNHKRTCHTGSKSLSQKFLSTLS